MCCSVYISLWSVTCSLKCCNTRHKFNVNSFCSTTGAVRGGKICYANTDEGSWNANTNYNYEFTPPHNSTYMFFGSYAHHAVGSITEGIRVSIVLFYQPKIRFKLLIYMWGKKTMQCPDCYKLSSNRKSLLQHRLSCLKQVSFNRFKEENWNFDPSKES